LHGRLWESIRCVSPVWHCRRRVDCCWSNSNVNFRKKVRSYP
jgi:hypothetical protein